VEDLKFNARLLQCSLKNENKDKDLLLNILKVQIGVSNAHSNSDPAHREQGNTNRLFVLREIVAACCDNNTESIKYSVTQFYSRW
jgi:hypothetical protein